MPELPAVPIVLEGSSVLHQMFRFDWEAWKKLPAEDQRRVEAEAVELLQSWEKGSGDAPGYQSAIYSLVGHKGDLLFLHFRDSIAALNTLELELAQTGLNAFLQPQHSYLSVVELGLYESSAKTYAALAEKGFAQWSPEWNAGVQEVVARQSAAMAQRPGQPPCQVRTTSATTISTASPPRAASRVAWSTYRVLSGNSRGWIDKIEPCHRRKCLPRARLLSARSWKPSHS